MSMPLGLLLEGVPVPEPGLVVGGLTENSREVCAGDAFLAVRGARADGHEFVADAERRGAVAVLCEHDGLATRLPQIVVPQLRERRGALAARFYGDPSRRLRCVGVTGTNGKTSITHYLADLATRLGHPCGYLGTIGWGSVDRLERARLTTEDAVTVQKRLALLLERGHRWAALEVSSHALAQRRVDDVRFRAAVFSNLSRDHLDYHANVAEYGAAKARLFGFEGLELAVVNTDDAFGRELARTLPEGPFLLTYGGRDADIRWSELTFEAAGLAGRWHTPWGTAPFRLPLVGEFSVANMAAALGVLCGSGLPFDAVVRAQAEVTPVPGRMEFFRAAGRAPLVVDYAHTPDALDKALAALRPHTTGRLVCVFGCGGDRDPGKRPLMARAAERHADVLWLTSDNPRSEDPEQILDQMAAGLEGRSGVDVHRNADRPAAITAAWRAAAPGDVVLVAGKGHEDYQEIAGERRPYSDRVLVANLLGVEA